MTYTRKQIQNFTGEEQIEFKTKDGGKASLFSLLTDFKNWLQTQLGLSTETVTISIQDEVVAANSSITDATNNADLGIIVAASTNSTSTVLMNESFNNISSLTADDIFTSFSYSLDAISEEDTFIIITVVINKNEEAAQNNYMARVPIGKGNQTVQFFVKLTEEA